MRTTQPGHQPAQGNPLGSAQRSLSWTAIWAVVALVASLLVVLGPPSIAKADTAPHRQGEPRTVSADRLPTVQINGVVWDQVIVGDRVYVTGQFTQARPAGASPGQNETPRANILAYNLQTGALIQSWAPSLNAQGMAIIASEDGSRIYVGGDFSQVNGTSRLRIAALDAQTGAVIQGFNPSANNRVAALAIHDNTLYLGGHFTTVGGQPRSRLASVNSATGALQPWAPSTDREVVTMIVHPDSGRVIVGGSFSSVNGQTQRGMTSLHGVTGAVMPWAANQVIQNYGTDTQISSLITDGDTIYGVGWAYFGAGSTTANLEGTFAANPLTGAIKWINGCRGDQFSIAVQGDVLYTAGHPHDCGMVNSMPEHTPRVEQRALAMDRRGSSYGRYNAFGPYSAWGPFAGRPATDVLHWIPSMSPGDYTGAFQAGYSVEANDEYVVYGGEFPRVNNTNQQGLVRFAVRDIAPNSTGLVGTGGMTPQLAQVGPGAVRVAWTAPWDYDNERLTFEVLRGATLGGSVVIANGQIDTNRWTQPPMAFLDTTAPQGTTQTYRIRVVDPYGNGGVGGASTITVPPGTALNSSYSNSVRSNGAIHHWRLDEPTGTLGRDLIGSNDLTLVETAQRNVSGALLSETSPSTRFPASTSTTTVRGTTNWWQSGPQTFSMEAWFNTTSSQGGKIIGFGDTNAGRSSTNLTDRHLYMTNNGQVRFGLRPDYGERRTINSQPGLNDGEWHHVVASLGESGAHLYIDGELVAQDATLTKAQVYWGYWRIGGDRLTSWPSTPTREAFAGDIDEVAVYPSALTPSQVRANHNASGRGVSPNLAPNAIFTHEIEGLRVGVDGSGSSDPDGEIVSYIWEFGDGTFGSGVSASHTYAKAGEYELSLTVTDDDGESTTTSREVQVAPPPINEDPQAAFTFTVENRMVSVDASTSTDDNDDIVHYAWDFGDGLGGAGPLTNHTYAADGHYNVTLTVTDGGGLSDSVTHEVPVTSPTTNQKPRAVITVTSADGLTMNASAAESFDTDGEIASYEWDFGSGFVVGETTISHEFPEAGTYIVRLRVTDDDGATDIAEEPVTVEPLPVNQPPEASFSVATSGLSVTLTSTSTDPDGQIVDWAWQLGDGAGADGPVVIYTFGQAGTYHVSLTVKDNGTATDSVTMPVTVGNPSPTGQAPIAEFVETLTGLNASFDASTSSDPDGSIVSYAWAFGDGGTGAGVTPTRTYLGTGSYTVTLTVTDNDGLSDSVQRVLEVKAPPGATTFATDTFSRSTSNGWGVADLGGSWTSGSSASVFSVSNGQGRMIMPNPGSGPGIALGGVSAQDINGVVDIGFDKPATGSGVYATYMVRRSGTNDYRVKVRPMTSGTQVLLGRSVGGVETILADTVLPWVYTPSEAIRVRLEVQGDGTTALRTKVWRVGDLEPGNWLLTATDSTAVLQNAGGVGLITYLSGSATNAPVTLLADNLHLGGIGQSQVNQAPVAAFTTVVAGARVTVDASTSTDADGTITNYEWGFSDGTSGTGLSTSHSFETEGTYTVTLTVTDNDGAGHQVTRTITVAGPEPGNQPFALDTFNRTVSNGMGSADIGGPWSISGTASSFSVSEGRARITASPSQIRAAYLPSALSEDFDLTVDVSLNSASSGSGAYVSVVGRRVSPGNEYAAKLRYMPNGQVIAYLTRTSGAEMTLAWVAVPGVNASANDVLRVRLRGSGSASTTVSTKIWPANGVEPSAWLLASTDATPPALQAPGHVGLVLYLSSTWTGPAATLAVGDLRVE